MTTIVSLDLSKNHMSNFQSKKTLEFIQFYIEEASKNTFNYLIIGQSWMHCLHLFDAKAFDQIKPVEDPYHLDSVLKSFFKSIDNYWFKQEVQEEDVEDE